MPFGRCVRSRPPTLHKSVRGLCDGWWCDGKRVESEMIASEAEIRFILLRCISMMLQAKLSASLPEVVQAWDTIASAACATSTALLDAIVLRVWVAQSDCLMRSSGLPYCTSQCFKGCMSAVVGRVLHLCASACNGRRLGSAAAREVEESFLWPPMRTASIATGC